MSWELIVFVSVPAWSIRECDRGLLETQYPPSPLVILVLQAIVGLTVLKYQGVVAFTYCPAPLIGLDWIQASLVRLQVVVSNLSLPSIYHVLTEALLLNGIAGPRALSVIT